MRKMKFESFTAYGALALLPTKHLFVL